MAKNRTKPEKHPAMAFINAIEDETRRTDSKVIMKLTQDITDREREQVDMDVLIDLIKPANSNSLKNNG